MANTIAFTTHYFGDQAPRNFRASPASMEVMPLASNVPSNAALRVRASGLTGDDIAALSGTNWSDGTVSDPRTGQPISGKVSALEVIGDGELEFILDPDP